MRCDVDMTALAFELAGTDVSWLLDNVLVVDIGPTENAVLVLVKLPLGLSESVLEEDAVFGIELIDLAVILPLLLFTVPSQDPLLVGKTRSPAVIMHCPFSNKLSPLYSSIGGGFTTTSTPSIAPNASSHPVCPTSLLFCTKYTSTCFNPPPLARSTPHCAQSSTYLKYFLKYGIYTVAHFATKEYGVEAIE